VLFSASEDAKVKNWHIADISADNSNMNTYSHGSDSVLTMEFEGDFMYTGTKRGYIFIWDIKMPHNPIRSIKVGKFPISVIAVLNKRIFIAANTNVLCFNHEGSELDKLSTSHNAPILCLAIGGGHLYTGSEDYKVKQWLIGNESNEMEMNIEKFTSPSPTNGTSSSSNQESPLYQIINDNVLSSAIPISNSNKFTENSSTPFIVNAKNEKFFPTSPTLINYQHIDVNQGIRNNTGNPHYNYDVNQMVTKLNSYEIEINNLKNKLSLLEAQNEHLKRHGIALVQHILKTRKAQSNTDNTNISKPEQVFLHKFSNNY